MLEGEASFNVSIFFSLLLAAPNYIDCTHTLLRHVNFKSGQKVGLAIHAYNPRTQEAEAGRLL